MCMYLPVGATTIGSAGDIDGAVATGVWAKIKKYIYILHLDFGTFCSTPKKMFQIMPQVKIVKNKFVLEKYVLLNPYVKQFLHYFHT